MSALPRLRLTRRDVVTGAVAGGLAMGLPGTGGARETRLEIVGNELRQGGEPVRLVGVAAGDPFYIRKGRLPTDFAVIAQAWRANAVRISLHPGHWRAGSAVALERLGADIAAARAAGLFVIVDWHVIGFPGHYMEHPDPSWGLRNDIYDPDLDLAIGFWTEMARSFGRDDGVLFELWNEPVVDPKLWTSTGQHWPLLKATWMRLIEVIRRHSDAIILATGGRWAHDLKGVAHDLIPDDRVAYSWHCYPYEDKYLPDRWTGSLDGLSAVRPVVVTEWGFCGDCVRDLRGTPDDFGIPFTRDVLDRLGLHSTAWCWSPAAAPAMLESDWTTATVFGSYVRRYLEAANGPPGGRRLRG
jgi:hypothetical protein